MTHIDWIWLVCLIIVCGAFYHFGKEDGKAQGQILSEEALYDLEMYRIDKYFEHERWKEMRRAGDADL